MSSEKQVAANQQNARSSTGPRDTSKTSRNATKHGLLGTLLTPDDQEAFARKAMELCQYYRPVGPIETWLVTRMSLLMIRVERATGIELVWLAQQTQWNRVSNDAVRKNIEVQALLLGTDEKPIQCALNGDDLRTLNDSIGRYETALENKFYKTMHELERLQRLRKGEHVPAPAVGDLTVHGPAASVTMHKERGNGNLVNLDGI